MEGSAPRRHSIRIPCVLVLKTLKRAKISVSYSNPRLPYDSALSGSRSDKCSINIDRELDDVCQMSVDGAWGQRRALRERLQIHQLDATNLKMELDKFKGLPTRNPG